LESDLISVFLCAASVFSVLCGGFFRRLITRDAENTEVAQRVTFLTGYHPILAPVVNQP